MPKTTPMSNKKCEYCGFVSFADATECKRCRKPLIDEDGAEVVEAEQTTPANLAACPDCGNYNSREALACVKCGRPLRQKKFAEEGFGHQLLKGGCLVLTVLLGLFVLLMIFYK